MTRIITTEPAPIIINNSSILIYTNSEKIAYGGEKFILQDSLGNNVSNEYTSSGPIPNIISTNLGSTYSTTYSYCLYSSSGNIYTSMEKSSISGNGFIQLTDPSGNSSVYLQFNNTATPPIPSSRGSPQFPTSLGFDSYGYLYFLVFGDNNIYKINNINEPAVSFVQYNKTTSDISAPYDMEINLNTNYIYITSTNPPRKILQLDTSWNISYLQNYTATGASYGICADKNNNLYIGYANGIIGKYDLNTKSFTQNYISLSGQGIIYGLSYNSSQNMLLVNTSSTNIYWIVLLPTPSIVQVITNSGILGGFSNDNNFTIYGTTTTNIINYNFNNTLTFNNLIITNPGLNSLNIYNQSSGSIYDNINVYATKNINYYYQNTLLTSLFQPIIYGEKYPNPTGYKTNDGQDLNEIFADISSDNSNSLGYNIGYKVGNKDLSEIFAKYEHPT